MTDRSAARFVAAALGLGGCVGVLGLNDYGAIADQLCVCPALDGVGPQRCRDRVESSLSEDPGAAEVWLARFDDKHCGDSCEQAHACFDQAPVCTTMDQACLASAECCGSSDASREAGCCEDPEGNGTCCASCVPCGVAAASETARSLCVDGDGNNASLASCVCGAVANGLCADLCGGACDDPIAVSAPCFACLLENSNKPCSTQIGICRSSSS